MISLCSGCYSRVRLFAGLLCSQLPELPIACLPNSPAKQTQPLCTMQLLATEPSRMLRHVTPLLLCDNEEAVVEAARAFGNFSRAPEAREYLVRCVLACVLRPWMYVIHAGCLLMASRPTG